MLASAFIQFNHIIIYSSFFLFQLFDTKEYIYKVACYDILNINILRTHNSNKNTETLVLVVLRHLLSIISSIYHVHELYINTSTFSNLNKCIIIYALKLLAFSYSYINQCHLRIVSTNTVKYSTNNLMYNVSSSIIICTKYCSKQ